MTDQVNLNLVWASGGGRTDPDLLEPGKYEDGWVSQRPTFQNFNFMLNGLDANTLALAEKGNWEHQLDINYVAGASVRVAGVVYYCHADNINIDPTADVNEDYWSLTPYFGSDVSTKAVKGGLEIATPARSGNVWSGSDATVGNSNSLINLTATAKNWLLGNVSGELVAVDVDTQVNPDGRAIGLSESITYRLFHEGHAPVVAEVAGAVEEAPADGKQYARKGATATSGSWVPVTSTAVGLEPPQAAIGAGAGWYNLVDGKLYVDIDDSDTSQWVPASPPTIPASKASDVTFDPTGTTLTSTNMQDAIVELYNLI